VGTTLNKIGNARANRIGAKYKTIGGLAGSIGGGFIAIPVVGNASSALSLSLKAKQAAGAVAGASKVTKATGKAARLLRKARVISQKGSLTRGSIGSRASRAVSHVTNFTTMSYAGQKIGEQAGAIAKIATKKNAVEKALVRSGNKLTKTGKNITKG
jgi:hypothetical protein